MFADVRWFDDRVVWLAPEPDEPLRALTAAVFAEFPETPPYGGEHNEPIPHLTVGHDWPADVLTAAAAEITPRLPIRSRVRAVHLLVGSAEPDSWRVVADLELGEVGRVTAPRSPGVATSWRRGP